ncbi:MAG: FAD-dependent oxidoreductase [Ilumatobacteraceae bacterium]|nr:FAD-dependent oxidoreductase [Ilumatobacteraceae bacterium]
MTYDLVVVGMGSAGLTATEFATGLGLRVAVVERARIGGDCLWTGCVPSKALVASAKVAHTMRNAHRVGIGSVEPVIDLPTVWRRARSVQAEIAATDDNPHRYRQMGADLFTGQARLTGPNEVTVHADDGTYEVLATRFVLLCTGSRPHIPTIDGLSTDWCLTSENLFQLNAPPASLAIIGGGPMGVEMAQTLQRLGVEVTVFQRAHTLLPGSERSLVSRLAEMLTQEGVVVHTTADVRACVRRSDGLVDVEANVGHDGKRVHPRVAGVLLAAGRTANTDDLGLQEHGIEVTERGVQVDDRGRTAVRTVYAAGDAAGRRYLTNSAGYEAVRAVRDMFFPGKGSVDGVIPSCVFSDPELATVGLTVDEAEEQFGTDSDSWRIDLAHNDRARTDAHLEGAVVVVTAKGRIVGAHILAPAAGEMIHELSLAIQRELRLEELAEAVHVYPTVAGAIGQLATESAYEKAHRLRWMMKRR